MLVTRVLIVDDHAGFRRLAARLLARAGLEVVGQAVDGSSALRQIAVLQPDAVLLDVMLPDRSGVDVALEILGGADAPRIVLTSSRDRGDFGRTDSLPDGCIFVPKHELSAGVLSAALGRT